MFQNPNDNFTKCPHCDALLIWEEFSVHTSFRIKSIFIGDNRIWVSDRKEWLRWYGFPPKNKHPFKTPTDSTEPNFLFFRILYRQIIEIKEALLLSFCVFVCVI
jgi:hypothetical protein